MKYIITVLLFISTSSFAEPMGSPYQLSDAEQKVAFNAVKEKLLDPDSFKLRGEIHAINDSSHSYGVVKACFRFNAKNTYGGYTSPQLAYVYLMTHLKDDGMYAMAQFGVDGTAAGMATAQVCAELADFENGEENVQSR